MVWCVLFVGLLMFDLGIVVGCALGGNTKENISSNPNSSAVNSLQGKNIIKVPYEPTVNEKFLMEDFKMINEFNGYREVTEHE